jgi:hypothetical protein
VVSREHDAVDHPRNVGNRVAVGLVPEEGNLHHLGIGDARDLFELRQLRGNLDGCPSVGVHQVRVVEGVGD